MLIHLAFTRMSHFLAFICKRIMPILNKEITIPEDQPVKKTQPLMNPESI